MSEVANAEVDTSTEKPLEGLLGPVAHRFSLDEMREHYNYPQSALASSAKALGYSDEEFAPGASVDTVEFWRRVQQSGQGEVRRTELSTLAFDLHIAYDYRDAVAWAAKLSA